MCNTLNITDMKTRIGSALGIAPSQVQIRDQRVRKVIPATLNESYTFDLKEEDFNLDIALPETNYFSYGSNLFVAKVKTNADGTIDQKSLAKAVRYSYADEAVFNAPGEADAIRNFFSSVAEMRQGTQTDKGQIDLIRYLQRPPYTHIPADKSETEKAVHPPFNGDACVPHKAGALRWYKPEVSTYKLETKLVGGICEEILGTTDAEGAATGFINVFIWEECGCCLVEESCLV